MELVAIILCLKGKVWVGEYWVQGNNNNNNLMERGAVDAETYL
jgi:hypothetical protein